MRNRLVWSAVAIACGIGTAPAWAMEYRLEDSVAVYRWVEKLGISGLSDPEESGALLQLGGYVSGFPSAATSSLTLRGDVRLLVGGVQYDTYNQDLTSPGLLVPITTHTSYVGSTQEGSFGLRAGFRGGYLETFVGLGYRWWWRDIGGATGYPEYYRVIYSRVGLRTEHGLRGTAKVRMTFSVDPPLWARETIDFTGSAYNDPNFGGVLVVGQKFTVNNGLSPGWTIEVGIRQANTDLTGYWQAVRLDESNVVMGYDSTNPAARRFFGQPESHQDLFGLRLGVSF